MRKMHQTLRLLIFALAFIFSEIKCEDSFFELSDDIKEDLFNIYTGVALIERGVVGAQVTPNKITYYLYTKNNLENYTKIDPENPVELNNTDVPIVFIIHGWIAHRGNDWYEDLKNAFLKRNDRYYVVQVDWSPLSFQGYLLSSHSTKDVGNLIAKFIMGLHNNYSIPLSNFLLVGHSLGGQISGFIGKNVQKLTNQKLPRIVALDPAGPFFRTRPIDEKLNKNDAEVVQVIHTDGGTFGHLLACGTIDFFPNGGTTQPGCKTLTLLDPSTITDAVVCDHQRGYQYFIEAVLNPKVFQAVKCNNWATYLSRYLCDDETVTMGNLESKTIGQFYLTTSNEAPFAELKRGIKGLLSKI